MRARALCCTFANFKYVCAFTQPLQRGMRPGHSCLEHLLCGRTADGKAADARGAQRGERVLRRDVGAAGLGRITRRGCPWHQPGPRSLA